MKKNATIIYVNFSPYDNAGRILDFLIENFSDIIHFSYDHLRLENGRKTNVLTIYHQGVLIKSHDLVPLRTPEFLRFPSLPIVAMLIFIQTYWYSKINLHGKKADYYLTVNAYTAWVGNILRNVGFVKKTIFWLWDYFPAGYPDIRIRILRWMYWKFDKPSLMGTDIITCISYKLLKLRYNFGALGKNRRYTVIPIGTNPRETIANKPKQIIGFLGMIKSSQGLDFVFDSIPKIHKKYPRLKFEIIGSGPEESLFRKRAAKWKTFVKFYGYIESENTVDRIMSKWHMGLATYAPYPSNESYWTDPSKIKAYLSQGVPVITTDVPSFSKEITKHAAGIVIPYKDTEALIQSIDKILSHNKRYAQNALTLAKGFYYKKIYQKFFRA